MCMAMLSMTSSRKNPADDLSLDLARLLGITEKSHPICDIAFLNVRIILQPLLKLHLLIRFQILPGSNLYFPTDKSCRDAHQ